MTDEDYSELAECLESACEEWIAKGGRLVPYAGRYEHDADDCRCPIGALLIDGPRFPLNASGVVDAAVAFGFMTAFDGRGATGWDARGEELGRQFRARYVTGAEP